MRSIAKPALLSALFLVALLAGAAPGYAENLGPDSSARIHVGDQVVGSYRLFVTSAPDPAVVGKLTLVVRVKDPATDRVVQDATARATLVAEDDAVITVDLTHQNAGGPLDYAAHIPMEKPGTWTVTLDIVGPAGQQSQVRFVQRVTQPRSGATLLLVAVPFLAMLVAGGVWWFRHTGNEPSVSA